MKPRGPIARVSVKRLAKNGGKMFSTVRRSLKPIPQVNVSAKAKRDKRYRKALSSAHWKFLRLQTWEKAGPDHICEYCGDPIQYFADMQLAHKTYARLGRELPEDVALNHRWCNSREAALRGKRIRRTA